MIAKKLKEEIPDFVPPTAQELAYKSMIEDALRKWLKGDPSTTNLISILIEDVAKVIEKQCSH